MLRSRRLIVSAVVLIPAAAWPQGSPLGPEFRVNTYTLSDQLGPSVARSPAGDFVVVWKHRFPGGAAGAIEGQRYSSSGAPLGSAFRVNTYGMNYQSTIAVASDGVANFIVVWASTSQDGSSLGVVGQRYDASGAPLGIEFRVNTYTTGSQVEPDVASDPAGNFVVVWGSDPQDGSLSGVFGQRFTPSGAPAGAEFRVNSFTTNAQGGPSVAIDDSGNFIVVWSGLVQDGSGIGVFGQRFAASGGPLGPEFRVNTYTTNLQMYPDVSADAAGDFVVTWGSAGQEGEPGGGGGGPPWGVYAQRYASSGSPVGPELRVNTYTTSNQFHPAVVTDAAGNFVIVWASAGQDNSEYGIFGQRYAASGVPSGPEFRINTFTTNAQTVPVVGSDGAGNFVVAWQSGAQDGLGWGVFAQRYGRIVPVELIHYGVE